MPGIDQRHVASRSEQHGPCRLQNRLQYFIDAGVEFRWPI
jgi:hypothetical protein